LPTYILTGPEEGINMDSKTSSKSIKLIMVNSPKKKKQFYVQDPAKAPDHIDDRSFENAANFQIFRNGGNKSKLQW
jgi:hypothetical protein